MPDCDPPRAPRVTARPSAAGMGGAFATMESHPAGRAHAGGDDHAGSWRGRRTAGDATLDASRHARPPGTRRVMPDAPAGAIHQATGGAPPQGRRR
jgi:hypothetical protein